jgi:hypothetical protein
LKTSTIVVLGAIAVAGVGGFLYWQHTKSKAVVAAQVAASKQPTSGSSTTDKIVGAVAAGIPLAQKIVELWA